MLNWIKKLFIHNYKETNIIQVADLNIMLDLLEQVQKYKIEMRDLTKSYYITTNEVEYKNFISNNKVNEKKYNLERFNCIDFSYKLMADASEWINGVALFYCKFLRSDNEIVNGKYKTHACNMYIDNDKRILKFIEPQTDYKFTSADLKGNRVYWIQK